VFLVLYLPVKTTVNYCDKKHSNNDYHLFICGNFGQLRCLRAFESNYKNLASEKAQSDCEITLFARQFHKKRNENA
jgi:hypothetical protein